MIRITPPASVRFKVAGTTTDGKGESEDFGFMVDAIRLRDTHAVRELETAIQEADRAGSKTPITDALVPRMTGWTGPVDDMDQPVEFTPENCRAVLNQPGIAALVLDRFIAACTFRG
jgi:hypothetical protein